MASVSSRGCAVPSPESITCTPCCLVAQLISVLVSGPGPADGAPLETHDARTLMVVRPSKRDKIKIIKAETQDMLGVTGTLIGIDNTDGIVKCDVSNDMKILDMTFLAKVMA